MGTKLRIVKGAGAGFEVDSEVAGRYSGRADEVLVRICRDHIKDQGLLDMLQHPSVALEQYSDGESGPVEAPLPPGADWQRIVNSLKQSDQEIGAALRHDGGMFPPSGGGGDPGGHAGGPPAHTMYIGHPPLQRLIRHPENYVLSNSDAAAVAEGRAVYLTGNAFAKAVYLSRQTGSTEVFFYWLARRDTPLLITDLVVPEQRVTSASCSVDPSEVLRVNRFARSRGCQIVAAGHSHGTMAVFSSCTDRGQLDQLSREQVGFQSRITTTIAGSVAEEAVALAVPDGEAPAALRQAQGGPEQGRRAAETTAQPPPAPQATRVFEAKFEARPELTVRITTPALPDVKPEALSVELVHDQRRLASSFATFNARGEYLFPIKRSLSCGVCGNLVENSPQDADVSVHVVGPVHLSEGQKKAIAGDVASKVRQGYGYAWSGQGWPYDHDPYPQYSGWRPNESNNDKPTDFAVYRRGTLEGVIPATVLEEAAYHSPELAEALGWAKKPKLEVLNDPDCKSAEGAKRPR
jgi:hypothetical protein